MVETSIPTSLVRSYTWPHTAIHRTDPRRAPLETSRPRSRRVRASAWESSTDGPRAVSARVGAGARNTEHGGPTGGFGAGTRNTEHGGRMGGAARLGMRWRATGRQQINVETQHYRAVRSPDPMRRDRSYAITNSLLRSM